MYVYQIIYICDPFYNNSYLRTYLEIMVTVKQK